MFDSYEDAEPIDLTHLTDTPLTGGTEVPMILPQPITPGRDQLPTRHGHLS